MYLLPYNAAKSTEIVEYTDYTAADPTTIVLDIPLNCIRW